MSLLTSLAISLRLKPVLTFLDAHAARNGNGPLSIVDLGCGDGSLKSALVERGHTVTTCDLCHGDVCTDFNNPLPFEENQFDVAISMAVAEHLREPHLFLQELRRVGRAVIMTTPSAYSPPVLDFLAVTGLLDPGHIRDHRTYLTKGFIKENGYDHSFFSLWMNQLCTCVGD